VQDTYFRHRAITATWDFAQLVRRLAKENDCLFYDWYQVAGGRDAMRTWYAYGLALPDHVHLSTTGYALKGDLLARALLNAVAWRKQNPKASTLWMTAQQSEMPRSVSAWLKAVQPFQRRPDLIQAIGHTQHGERVAKVAPRGQASVKRSKSKSPAKSKFKASPSPR
jgi:hypothetical protein